ncbi:MAG: bifunctional oligoribonuclease/PAP phosphatase NrnA [Spirochaetales bacterium]|nr:bifunctional oligoribonuclease/PAP phosphatase NrnA [Spirochaetales bacterium]
MIVSHDNPDCDAISSVIAFEYMMSSFGKRCVCINSDMVPANLSLFDFKKVYSDYEKSLSEINLNLKTGKTYCLIVLDTHEMRMTGKFAASDAVANAESTIYIDHHTVHQDNSSDAIFCNPDKSSVCEIIYDIYKSMNAVIPTEIADALYAGISSDTGQFRFAKTTTQTLAAVSDLVSRGTNPARIYEILYEHEPVGKLILWKLVMATLTLFADNSIAVLSLTKEMLQQTGVPYSETGDLVNIPLGCDSVRAVVFCKENEKGGRKIAMRSKGDVDVAVIAHSHGGGGHKNAAGFKISSDDDLTSVKNNIIEEISKIL